MNTQIPEWWFDTSHASRARQLRLAVVQNTKDGGLITEAQAREILSGPLEPGNPSTVYDDSEWLNVLRDMFAAAPPEKKHVDTLIQENKRLKSYITDMLDEKEKSDAQHNQL